QIAGISAGNAPLTLLQQTDIHLPLRCQRCFVSLRQQGRQSCAGNNHQTHSRRRQSFDHYSPINVFLRFFKSDFVLAEASSKAFFLASYFASFFAFLASSSAFLASSSAFLASYFFCRSAFLASSLAFFSASFASCSAFLASYF